MTAWVNDLKYSSFPLTETGRVVSNPSIFGTVAGCCACVVSVGSCAAVVEATVVWASVCCV